MALKVCECGFANPADAGQCALCGALFESIAPKGAASSLRLVQGGASDAAVVSIPAPGGVIGRAGDFSSDLFSARVSGIHANLSLSETGWEIEHLGRNRSAILRAGEWIELPKGAKVGLLDGDQLRLADMLFWVVVEKDDERLVDENSRGTEDPQGTDDAAHASEDRWVIVCPVCGRAYEAADADARIDSCETCIDALDKRKISSVRPMREAAVAVYPASR